LPPGIDTTYGFSNSGGAAVPPGVLSSWTAWSPQAMLLPYIEQTPLYNAANFNWNCCYDSPLADRINRTVYNVRIASFLCPSDGIAGQQNINNYLGSIGASTIKYPGDGNTTGIFRVANSVNSTGSVTIASITDGTSNTIAFGEGIV